MDKLYYDKVPTEGGSYQEIIFIESDGERFGVVSCPRRRGVFFRFPNNRIDTVSEYVQEHKIKPLEPKEDASRLHMSALISNLHETPDEGIISSDIVRSVLNSWSIPQ